MVDSETEAARLDKAMGARLRRARKARGYTQTELAEVLGVTFQQIQKYESGANRISSSAMVLVCRTLEVSPLELMDVSDTPTSGIAWDLLAVEGSEQLLRHYGKIASPRQRRAVVNFAKSLSEGAAD